MGEQGALSEKTTVRVKEPSKYQVIMLNDDFTTMEFVVSILVDIFQKDPASAEQIMMYVHKNGRAVVGVYPYDMAATKTDEALRRARQEGFPFRMLIVEA